LDGLALYSILQLDKSATSDDIKKAYRECARIHHPDKGGSAERFAKVQAAFETLSDPRKRAVYDEW
ncbi:DnaJ protein, partial [Coccomyxa subellipsoidea C-169]